jgi:hypothetical protein
MKRKSPPSQARVNLSVIYSALRQVFSGVVSCLILWFVINYFTYQHGYEASFGSGYSEGHEKGIKKVSIEDKRKALP